MAPLRTLVLAVAALLLVPPAAGAWTAPRAIGSASGHYHELALGFNASGDAMLLASTGYSARTALRPAGRTFGPLQRARGADMLLHERPVLAPDGAGLLLGEWFDELPGIPDDSDYECCERAMALTLRPDGRTRGRHALTPQGDDAYVGHLETDERGGVGATLRMQSDGRALMTYGRVGALGPVRPVAVPPGLFPYDVAIRPDGRGTALLGDSAGGLLHAPVRPDGGVGPPTPLMQPLPGQRILLPRLAYGRRGHAWAVWTTAPSTSVDGPLWAAARRSDGSFSEPRQVPGGAPNAAKAAVDDSGGLTLMWSTRERELVYASSPPGGDAFGPLRTLARGDDFTYTELAAGPDGRLAFAWEEQPSKHFAELWVATGRRGASTPKPLRIARSRRNDRFVQFAIGISRRSAAHLAWYDAEGDTRVRFRYSVHRVR